MKRLLFVLMLFFVFSYGIVASQIVLSVSDFIVESDNPEHKYIGKGLSRLVAGELRKSDRIELLEREELNRLLDEQELSLSGLTDDSKQIRIGMLLSAQYIVFGEIINMGRMLLLSLRMVESETSKVVWQEDITEKLESYDYIGAYFAQSILNHLNRELGESIEIEETIVKKIEKKEEKPREAIVKLSEGIEAFDNKDTKKAKKILEEVKKIDPENEVSNYFLNKLSVLSPKFKIELEKYVAAYNPASLGFLSSDRLYFWNSRTSFVDWQPDNRPSLGEGYSGYETIENYNAGYALPIFDNLGLDVEFIATKFIQKLNTPNDEFFAPTSTNIGGCLGIGYAFSDDFSIGLAGFFYSNGETHEELEVDKTFYDFYYSVDLGILIFLLDNFITLDLQAVYTSQEQRYFNTESQQIIEGAQYPLILDNTITLALMDNRLFTSIKGIEEIYLDDRGGFAFRLIPMLEYYVTDFLSLRGGYELYYIDQLSKSSLGHGFLAGFTMSLWNFEINMNYAFRNKPIRILPGYTLAESNLLFGIVYHLDLVTR